jgi:hypothetical protein
MDRPELTVSVSIAEALLAKKILAFRRQASKPDLEDIEFMMRTSGFMSAAEAVAAYEYYMSAFMVTLDADGVDFLIDLEEIIARETECEPTLYASLLARRARREPMSFGVYSFSRTHFVATMM